jgi:hypothetical protein
MPKEQPMAFNTRKWQQRNSILPRRGNYAAPLARKEVKRKVPWGIRGVALFIVTAVICVHVMRAQRDANNPNALMSRDGSNNGLTLETRSASGIQTTLAKLQGAGLASGAPQLLHRQKNGLWHL